MGKKPNFQKWVFRFLTLLIVAMATFCGEALITTRAAPLVSPQVPASCALEHTAGAGTKIFISSTIDQTVRNVLGTGTSSAYSLNCAAATVASPSLDPNGHTFTVGGITYDRIVEPNAADSLDALGPRKTDTATTSTYREIKVKNPNQDKVTWNIGSLNLDSSKAFTFAIHTYRDTTNLKFKLNGGNPTVGLQTNAFQVVYSSKSGVNKITLDFTGVRAGITVRVGDFFIGHTSIQ